MFINMNTECKKANDIFNLTDNKDLIIFLQSTKELSNKKVNFNVIYLKKLTSLLRDNNFGSIFATDQIIYIYIPYVTQYIEYKINNRLCIRSIYESILEILLYYTTYESKNKISS